MIREASLWDLPELCTFFSEYGDEDHVYSGMNLSRDKLNAYLVEAIKSEDQYVAVSVRGSDIHSVIWGRVLVHIWSDDLIGAGILTVTRKSSRGSRAAYTLNKSFEAWCKGKGCKFMEQGAHSGIDDNKPADRLFKGLGYEPVGVSYMKAI